MGSSIIQINTKTRHILHSAFTYNYQEPISCLSNSSLPLPPDPGFDVCSDDGIGGGGDDCKDDASVDLGTSTDFQSSPSATMSAIIVPTFTSLASSWTCRMMLQYNVYSPVLLTIVIKAWQYAALFHIPSCCRTYYYRPCKNYRTYLSHSSQYFQWIFSAAC